MTETARVIGFTPAAARQATARNIIEESVDVQLALGRHSLGAEGGRICQSLGNIRRAAQTLLGAESGQPAPERPATGGIADGYRVDILELLEELATRIEPVLEASWPGQQAMPPASDDALRVIGLAANNLANRVNAYLALRSVAAEGGAQALVNSYVPQRKLAAETGLIKSGRAVPPGNYAGQRRIAAATTPISAIKVAAAGGREGDDGVARPAA